MTTARVVGATDPTAEVELLVVLRPDPAGDQPRTLAEHSRLSLKDRMNNPRRSRASDEDRRQLAAWAEEHGLREHASMLGGRVVRLRGQVQQAEAALGVKTVLIDDTGEAVMGFHGEHSLPASVADAVIGVMGLDGRPSRREISTAQTKGSAYTPPQVAARYEFPPGHGSGQSIAILAMGGGFEQQYLDTYFEQTLGLPASPTIHAITVSGPGNAPNTGHDVEVYLDICVVGGIAYDATINVYFAQGGLSGQAAAISQAIDDGNCVFTSSCGSIWESSYSVTDRQALDAVLQQAADANVTVVHGASDRGSWGAPSGGPNPTPTDCDPHVTYPPSSPWITASGGTTLSASSETVWNGSAAGGGATGGGVSELYDVPPYQSAAGLDPIDIQTKLSGRGVPDVAAVADPRSAYVITVHGNAAQVGGDSATGPLWAALVAILNQNLAKSNDGTVGFLNPTIYGMIGSTAFNDITSGNNAYTCGDVTVAGYEAAKGWDACTGCGTPNGSALLSALEALA